MFSTALRTKLNCLDFLLLKGQSQEKVIFAKFVATAVRRSSLWQHFVNQAVLHLEPPCLTNHIFLTADIKI
jgi:hypothetical protein